MIERKKMTTLLINVISVKMLLTFPGIMIMNSGNSAWIEAIYNTAVIALIFWITCKVYTGNRNVIQIADMTGKKWLKILVGLVIFVVLLINFSSIIRIFPETVKMVLLQDIRVEYIILAFSFTIAVGAYFGIRPIAKINNMFMPIAAFILVISFFLLLPHYKVNNLLPIFGKGFKGIFVKGFNTVSLFSDILILNILLPHCENFNEAKKSGWRAIFISAGIAVVILISYCLIYPYPASEEFMIPIYQLARIIHVSNFFSRFEVIFQFVWSILLFLYSSIYIYVLSYVWQITFDLKYYKPLVFPMVVISSVVAIIPRSVIGIIEAENWEYYLIYPIAFLLPIIFGLYYKIKSMKEDKK